MPAPLLELRGVSKSFGGFAALSGVDIEVRQGERLGLIGPNGSGKTTLVNCISGTLRPDRGQVLFDGVEITTHPTYRRARAGITRSFQIPRPFGSMSVLDNLCIPLRYAAQSRAGAQRIEEEAGEILEMFGLSSKRDAPPAELTQIAIRDGLISV